MLSFVLCSTRRQDRRRLCSLEARVRLQSYKNCSSGCQLTFDIQMEGVAFTIGNSVGGNTSVETSAIQGDALEHQGVIVHQDSSRYILLNPLTLETKNPHQ